VLGRYANDLLNQRGKLAERTFARCYETVGMPRRNLRGRENILKRQLTDVGAFNLSLVIRKLFGAGIPPQLRNRAARLVLRLFRSLAARIGR